MVWQDPRPLRRRSRLEGQRYSQEQLKRDLVLNHYVNDRLTFTPGYFRVKGDTIDIFPPSKASTVWRIV